MEGAAGGGLSSLYMMMVRIRIKVKVNVPVSPSLKTVSMEKGREIIKV